MSDTQTKKNLPTGERNLFRRNLFMFSLGTVGRDFLYNFFNGFLLTFILLTKNLSAAQFGSITAIIIAARVFDALNDPLMGGIVANTRTKWGKYKPWQLIGAVLTSGVVILVFTLPLYGWAFIGLLAACYFLFSITFTMNDISYWGMMPTLTSDPDKRNKLTSAAQIFVSIGGGLSQFLIPVLTTGNVGTAAFGSVGRAFGILAVCSGIVLVGFQLFTVFGVKEPALTVPDVKVKRLTVKDSFRVIFKNDQLLWAAVCLLLGNIGTNVVTGGLSTMYVYFEFGYDGMLTVLFMGLSGAMSVVFTVLFPQLCRKWGRNKVLYFSTFLVMFGYLSLLLCGLFVPKGNPVDVTIFGFTFHFTVKYFILVVANAATGAGGMYMIQTINMANSVEYNEFKTGRREESIIFSLRPFANKMGSAISQGLVSLVYIVAGVLAYTNRISDIENAYGTKASPTAEEAARKLSEIGDVLASVSTRNKNVLLLCMCLIPIAFLSVALLLYKRFFKLDEKRMEEIAAALAARSATVTTDEIPRDEIPSDDAAPDVAEA